MRNTMRSVTNTLGMLGVALALGCGSKDAASGAAPAAAPSAPQAQAPAQPAAPAAPLAAELPAPSPDNPSSIDDAKFKLSLAPAGEYKAGQLARFVVQLEAKGVYHVNQEYPISISVSSPKSEIALPKAQFEKPDATQFAEKQARFEIPFTPSAAGAHAVMAQVKFAVCTEENCWEDARNLALALAVN